MKFVTFNIRYKWDGDGINSFVHRAGSVLDKIDTESPDIICFQEASEKIGDFLKKHLTDYAFCGVGREKDLGGEAMLVAVKKDTFRIESSYTEWYSPTPSIPGSRHEGQNVCPRTFNRVTVTRLGDNKRFRIYDTHFDYEKPEIRLLEAEQLKADIEKVFAADPLPTVVAGDLNALPGTKEISLLLGIDTPRLNDLTTGLERTCHGFGGRDNTDGFEKIDYIFCTDDLKKNASEASLWTDGSDGIWLSDHYPVAVEL